MTVKNVGYSEEQIQVLEGLRILSAKDPECTSALRT